MRYLKQFTRSRLHILRLLQARVISIAQAATVRRRSLMAAVATRVNFANKPSVEARARGTEYRVRSVLLPRALPSSALNTAQNALDTSEHFGKRTKYSEKCFETHEAF